MKMKDIEIGKVYASYSTDSTGYSKRFAKRVKVLDKGYEKSYTRAPQKRDGGLLIKVQVSDGYTDFTTAGMIREPWSDYLVWQKEDNKRRAVKQHNDTAARAEQERRAKIVERVLASRGITGSFNIHMSGFDVTLDADDIMKLLDITEHREE